MALQNITDTGGKYANGAIAQSETLAGKFSTLVDGIERIAVTIGNTISPVLKALLDDATSVTNNIIRMMNQAAMANKVGLSQKEQQRLFRQAGKEAEEMQRRRQGLPATGFAFGALNNQEFQRLQNERFEDLIRQEGFKRGTLKGPVTSPTLTGVTEVPALLSGGGGGGSGTTPAERAADATKKQIANLKEQAVLATGLTQQEKEMLQLKIEIQKAEDNRALVGDVLTNQHIEALENAFGQKQVEQSILQVQENQARQVKEAADAKKKAQEEEAKRAKKLEQIYENVGRTIQDGMVDALKGAMQGTMDLQKVASSVLDSLLNQVLQLITNYILFGSLTGGFTSGMGLLGGVAKLFGFKEDGGTVMGGKSYIVGEAGPELFTPGRTGSIAPNDAIGGSNVVVNVDAKGTSVEGDAEQSKQLGKAIGIAVQQELIKQQRPGGLLS